jgi:shikimate dehydrogenase
MDRQKTLQYGLVGKTLQHSFSKDYFTKKFEKLGLTTAIYSNFELHDIHALKDFCHGKAKTLSGFNITIPYKESIIPFLDALDPNAGEIGAVNTVIVHENKLIGYNTDFEGFLESIKPFLQKTHQKALILGTGGASKAVAHAFKTLNISYQFVSRNPAKGLIYTDLDKILLQENQIIVNTTPIGTFPHVNDIIDIPYSFLGKNHFVIDLIYNPLETQFLKNAKSNGAIVLNGLKMLELQAEKAWEIWNQ